MQRWTPQHAKFVGRVIFANFLILPLERYKNVIKEVEQSLYPRKVSADAVTVRRLSRAKIRNKGNKSPKAIAEIVKNKNGFSIRYFYGGFNKIYGFSGAPYSKLFYKLRRISSRNELTHRILKGIIERQKKFLETGNQIDLVPFSQVQLPVDNSWASRLVNRLSIITPFREEKPLKWFFQTQKDVNKRIIKQLLDKENDDIESGRQKKPLTDNQIRTKLESGYGVRLSRHSIGHCRKDMGIPPAGRRLSGYKYPPLSANFSLLYPLVLEEVLKCAPASQGIYEFQLKGREIEYSNGKTQVIYIGSTRNIRKRLREHLGKNSKNGHIRDFLKNHDCSFRYIQFSQNWKEEEGRLYGLFVSTYGAPPKCNRVKPGEGKWN